MSEMLVHQSKSAVLVSVPNINEAASTAKKLIILLEVFVGAFSISNGSHQPILASDSKTKSRFHLCRQEL